MAYTITLFFINSMHTHTHMRTRARTRTHTPIPLSFVMCTSITPFLLSHSYRGGGLAGAYLAFLNDAIAKA